MTTGLYDTGNVLNFVNVTPYRLGGVISAYKIVPDEIDEIKVCNLWKMSIVLSPLLKPWCLFKDKCHPLLKHPGGVLN